MPGEPAQPLSPVRPAWVGLAMRLAPDAGQAWLRPADPAHARMLRHLGARALHEPLLAELPVSAPGLDEEAFAGVTPLAGKALRALLPGQPKPVAALTRSPEVTLLLLQVLAGSGSTQAATRAALAAQVLFSLALSSALTETVTLTGPLVLQHGITRRGLVLSAGQRLVLERDALRLDGVLLDPWGPELGALLTEHHGFATERGALAELGALGAALHLIAERDPHAESLAELFVALEVVPPSAGGSRELELPLAIGRARLPRNAPALTLARALLRESALHKLTLLRLIDPVVHDEATLPLLLHTVDAWVARRLALDAEPPDAASSLAHRSGALTPLGQQLLLELG
ncbi:MAG: hypothetical protein IPI43_09880 [Sandaracinaceae bacterium]|nr:hypothetical protein [Sandaracinaceae bacterium]